MVHLVLILAELFSLHRYLIRLPLATKYSPPLMGGAKGG